MDRSSFSVRSECRHLEVSNLQPRCLQRPHEKIFFFFSIQLHSPFVKIASLRSWLSTRREAAWVVASLPRGSLSRIKLAKRQLEPQQARREADRAAASLPRGSSSRSKLAERQIEPQQARREADRAAASSPRDRSSRSKLAERQIEPQQACQEAARAAASSPRGRSSRSKLAERQIEPQQARREADRAAASSPRGRSSRSKLAERQIEPQQARREADRAAASSPRGRSSRSKLAERQIEPQQARREADRAAASSPRGRSSRSKLAERQLEPQQTCRQAVCAAASLPRDSLCRRKPAEGPFLKPLPRGTLAYEPPDFINARDQLRRAHHRAAPAPAAVRPSERARSGSACAPPASCATCRRRLPSGTSGAAAGRPRRSCRAQCALIGHSVVPIMDATRSPSAIGFFMRASSFLRDMPSPPPFRDIGGRGPPPDGPAGHSVPSSVTPWCL